MSVSVPGASQPKHTEGEFSYIVPMDEKPFRLRYEPGPGEKATNASHETRYVKVHDVRPVAAEMTLDGEGFAFLKHRSAVSCFDDEAAIKAHYYPECAGLVKAATGADRVVAFDHIVRNGGDSAADQPIQRAHNDYTETSGPKRVRDLMGGEAENLLRRRVAIVNVWRPINGPIESMPLGIIGASTIVEDDFIATDLVYRDRRGETYNIQFNDQQKWYYTPSMSDDEAYLLKCFDSDRGVARWTAHSGFVDANTPADAKPRESIEVRTMLFFDR
jgi:hypothetical protein